MTARRIAVTIGAVTIGAAALLLSACSGGAPEGPAAVDPAATGDGSVQVGYTLPTLMRDPLTRTVGDIGGRAGETTINLSEQGRDCYDFPTRLQADIAAGDPADLALLCMNALRQFIDAGVAQPIDDLIAADPGFDIGQYSEAALAPFRHDGRLYGLPNAVSTAVVYYNIDLMRQAGLDPDNPPQTWTEFADAARRLDDPAAGRDGAQWILYPSKMTYQGLVYSAGGSWLDPDEARVVFDQGPAEQAVDFLRQMQADGTMQLVEGAASAQAQDAFARGQVAMLVDSTANLRTIGSRITTFGFRLGPIPTPPGGGPAAGGQGMGFLMFAREPGEMNEAWSAMKALTSPQAATDVATMTGFLAANIAATQDPNLLGNYLAEDPNRSTADRLSSTSTVVYEFPGSRSVEIDSAITDQVELAVRGEKTIRQALDDAAQQVGQLLPQQR